MNAIQYRTRRKLAMQELAATQAALDNFDANWGDANELPQSVCDAWDAAHDEHAGATNVLAALELAWATRRANPETARLVSGNID